MFAQGYSDAISDLNGLSATMKSKTSVGQMRKAASDAMEAYRQAKAAVRASRPGVKATFEYLQSDYMKLMRYHQMAMNGDRLAFKTSEAEKACDLALNNKPYRPNPKAKSSHDLAEELKDALGEAY
jgi:alcohol dehydrogenase class IV